MHVKYAKQAGQGIAGASSSAVFLVNLKLNVSAGYSFV